MPPTALPPVAAVHVAFDPPDAGWIILRLDLDEAQARIAISQVFDPFDAMLDWLLAVVVGDDARLTIDEEGLFAHLDATTGAAPNLVRLTIWKDPDRDERTPILTVDAQVDRLALARAFHHGIRSFWDKPDRATFWNEWFWYGYPEWAEDYPDWSGPSSDWSRLDAILADR